MFLGAALPVTAHILDNPMENPAELTREAFATPYGRALVAEFNSVLRSSADASCLQSKRITPERLAQHGETLITKWGTRSLQTLASFINVSIYDTKFAETAGAGASAEVTRLKANPDVKRYIAIDRPRHLALVLDFMFEQFGRYVLISRINMGQVAPIATGNETLLKANPTERAEAEVERFLATSNSPAVQRYIDLSEQSDAAMAASLNTEQVRNGLGPSTLFRGADKDLAELCIGGRR